MILDAKVVQAVVDVHNGTIKRRSGKGTTPIMLMVVIDDKIYAVTNKGRLIPASSIRAEEASPSVLTDYHLLRKAQLILYGDGPDSDGIYTLEDALERAREILRQAAKSAKAEHGQAPKLAYQV